MIHNSHYNCEVYIHIFSSALVTLL